MSRSVRPIQPRERTSRMRASAAVIETRPMMSVWIAGSRRRSTSSPSSRPSNVSASIERAPGLLPGIAG